MTKNVVTGVVAEFEGKYWGVQYEDGHSTAYDFGPIENAKIGDPKFCRRPTDLTYKGSYDTEKLARARLVPVTKTTIYEVGSAHEPKPDYRNWPREAPHCPSCDCGSEPPATPTL